MPEFFGYLTGSLVGVCLLVLGVGWPVLILYFAWRLLRDVRRIADALEAQAPATLRTPALESRRPAPEAPRIEQGITLSALGR